MAIYGANLDLIVKCDLGNADDFAEWAIDRGCGSKLRIGAFSNDGDACVSFRLANEGRDGFDMYIDGRDIVALRDFCDFAIKHFSD